MAFQAHLSGSQIPLPAEIRLKIYKLLFKSGSEDFFPEIEDYVMMFEGYGKALQYYKDNSRIALPLLRTCKSVSAEASSVLYSENQFLMTSPEQTLHFANSIGPRNASSIRTLCLNVAHVTDWPSLKFFDVVLKFSSMRRLSIITCTQCDTALSPATIPFLKAAQVMLRRHATLRLVASRSFARHLRYEQPWRPGWKFVDMELVFLASENDKISKDGPILDVEEALNKLERFYGSSTR